MVCGYVLHSLSITDSVQCEFNIAVDVYSHEMMEKTGN